METVLDHTFVQKNWAQIVLLAKEKEPVDIWTDDRLLLLRTNVIREILIHCIHQQAAERMVQLASMISQTHRGEDRRTCQAICAVAIVRPSKQAALNARNESLKKEGKPEIKTCQGRYQVAGCLDFIDEFFKYSKRARKLIGKDEFKKLALHLGSSKNKQSTKKAAEELERFSEALEQPRKKTKAEEPQGHESTPTMGGRILFRILTMKNKTLEAVHAEMKARHIPMTDIEKERWTIADKRKKLRWHEVGRLSMHGRGTAGIKYEEVKSFVPESAEMNALKALQKEILAEEKEK